jgi:O-antigen/teichoic acid export membrane protein
MLRKFAGSSLLYIVGMMMNRGLGFLLLPLYTRHLTPDDYGILAVCATTSLLLGMVGTLSIEAVISIFYYKLEADEFRKLLRTIWLWTLISPLLLVGLLELLGPPMAARFLPQVAWDPYLRLALWIFYFNIAPGLILSLLMIEQRASAYAAFTVISFVVTTCLLIYFVAWRGEGALGSLRGQIVGGVIIAAASHWMILRRCWVGVWTWIDWRYLVTSLKFGIPFIPHVLSNWTLSVSDRLILGKFETMSALGLYNLAYTIGMIVILFGTALSSAYGPIYYQQAEDESFRAQLPRLLASYCLVHTSSALAISLLAPEMLRFMTQPQYYGAGPLVPWIAGGYWFYVTLYQLCMTVLVHYKRSAWTIWLSGPPALLNICLNLWLVPRYGVLAAAINTLSAYFLMAILGIYVSRRLDKLPFPWWIIAQMVAVAALTYWIGYNWLSLPNLALAVLAKGALLTFAGLLMVRISGFSVGEIARLGRSLLATKAVA